jgi:hypothetical protein
MNDEADTADFLEPEAPDPETRPATGAERDDTPLGARPLEHPDVDLARIRRRIPELLEILEKRLVTPESFPLLQFAGRHKVVRLSDSEGASLNNGSSSVISTVISLHFTRCCGRRRNAMPSAGSFFWVTWWTVVISRWNVFFCFWNGHRNGRGERFGWLVTTTRR